jgi:hypothetical protein
LPFRRGSSGLERGIPTIEHMTIQRIEHVGIVVDDFAAATEFSSSLHRRLELAKFHSPSNQGDNRHAPANTPGIRH